MTNIELNNTLFNEFVACIQRMVMNGKFNKYKYLYDTDVERGCDVAPQQNKITNQTTEHISPNLQLQRVVKYFSLEYYLEPIINLKTIPRHQSKQVRESFEHFAVEVKLHSYYDPALQTISNTTLSVTQEAIYPGFRTLLLSFDFNRLLNQHMSIPYIMHKFETEFMEVPLGKYKQDFVNDEIIVFETETRYRAAEKYDHIQRYFQQKDDWEQRVLAFVQSSHDRLGQSSVAGSLSRDTHQMIINALPPIPLPDFRFIHGING